MINAKDFGFLPEASPAENARALQRAVDCRGDIYIDSPGVYAIGKTVVLHSRTHLHFAKDVLLSRASAPEEAPYLFINAGAYTKEYDEDISVTGLRYSCNGHDLAGDTPIPGLRGHLSFFCVKRLSIRNLECLDLEKEGFCIQVCTFDDILVENVHIEGEKDAVHLGNGRGFVIRNGHFRTFDDPIALNAHDYASSNPQLGWLENGLVENCYDLDDATTTGFFCRILAGSWCDWRTGMQVQNSDSVIHGGRLYRVMMPPDGRIYTSVTPPTHREGVAFLDGICWVMTQETTSHNCGCRNLHFKEIHLQKRRPIAFSIHFDSDNWSRSVYPASEMPIQEDLTFENIYMENELEMLLWTRTPVRNLAFHGLFGEDARLLFEALPYEKESYPPADIRLCEYHGRRVTVEAKDGRHVTLHAALPKSEIEAQGNVEIAEE